MSAPVTLMACLFTLLASDAAIGAELPEAPAADSAAAPPAEGKPKLDTVTVEARRQLDRQVNEFVSSVIVHYMYDSLVRWDAPVCPLVAGLPRDQGEFMLARLSRNALDAHAPLAGEHCNPNFIVVVTAEPDVLLKRWWRRDPQMYNRNNGLGGVKRFMRSSQAVRCWYNSEFRTSDGTAVSADSLVPGLFGTGLVAMHVPVASLPTGSRIRYTAVQALSSVIIVADQKQLQQVNIGQLADYISMTGLAEIHTDVDTHEVPTILQLFRNTPEPPPQSLTAWDQSLLQALYTTTQANVMQASAIKVSMEKSLVSH